MTDTPTAKGWYPNPTGPGQRYFDGIAWTDVVASAPYAPPLGNQDAPRDGGSKKTAIAVGVCVLSGIGLVMSMQSASLLTGTGPIWMGVGVAAAGAACAFFLGAAQWARILAAVLLLLAVANAAYMEKQLSDKRNEISQMFNP